MQKVINTLLCVLKVSAIWGSGKNAGMFANVNQAKGLLIKQVGPKAPRAFQRLVVAPLFDACGVA